MDDGSKSYRALYLNTQKFDRCSQERLVKLLKRQWDIQASLNRDKQYYRIRISVHSIPRFKAIVQPYLLSQFKYKLPF